MDNDLCLWDEELEAARTAIRVEAREFVGRFPSADPGVGSPFDRARARREAEAALVLRSAQAVDREVKGRHGPLRLREFRPEHVEGVMLHIHGGGWMTGEPALTDPFHERLSRHLNLAIVSVDYRLAPEHPYPSGPDDCEAAALWVVDHAASQYGTERLLIGGESAGAHLSAVTLLRMRDRHGMADRFCGANLVFGPYDLSRTASATGVGVDPDSDVLSPDDIRFMTEQFTPGLTPEQRRQPDLSPLYAELGGMPPALFTVGTTDHLVDDTLFLAQRWVRAGNSAELLVYPDAPHGCIALPTVLRHWWPRLEAFLTRCLGGEGADKVLDEGLDRTP
jgi:acetyl esterase